MVPLTADVYFINLDRVPERAAFMLGQFSNAGISDPIRFPAIDARSAEMRDCPRYRPHSWGPYWTLRETEIAVFESHRAIWEKIVESDRPAAIFEDDVLISTQAGAIITALSDYSDRFEMAKLDALAGQVRLGPEMRLGDSRLHPITEVVASAAGYLLSPTGAQSLLRRSQSYCDHLDDFITRPARGYRAIQLTPGIAVQGMFADVRGRDDIPASIAGSERTAFGSEPTSDGRGPVPYRLAKEIRRGWRRSARKIFRDGQLQRQGGLIGEVPLASDLPGYRK
ncbi:glycosyltransferase family 25 protein [Primorskyibacter sp. S87]|uniref:glycosyltransferase family 25 protein n=1 Tax=Primorskyibacter sp. S87 TaxID=3415126 RepID=UPI003C7971C9